MPGWVDIESLTTGEVWRIRAETGPIHDVDCDGSVNSIDAVLILQFDAGLAAGLPCEWNGEGNGDGLANAIDATLILQYDAGLLETL